MMLLGSTQETWNKALAFVVLDSEPQQAFISWDWFGGRKSVGAGIVGSPSDLGVGIMIIFYWGA